MILASERAKIVYALDRAATVSGSHNKYLSQLRDTCVFLEVWSE
jgi:hypothetical protein